MSDQWVAVFASTDPYKVNLVVAMLQSNDIQSVVLNQQDSMYHNLNSLIEIKVVVNPADVLQAKHLLQSKEF